MQANKPIIRRTKPVHVKLEGKNIKSSPMPLKLGQVWASKFVYI